jgi:folate-binding protein YgfZ
MIPAGSFPGYDAARSGAAVIDRSDRGRIVVSGKDRASYLHGLLTNDIAALKPGEGCYSAYLTAQGRMIADMWVFELGDVILLELSGDVKDTVLAKLDQFIFTEDVQLGDVTDVFAGLSVIGPAASQAIAKATGARADMMNNPGAARISFIGEPAILLHSSDWGIPEYELLVAAGNLTALRSALHAAGAIDVDDDGAEALRIEAGVPRFHADMDEETIPLEAGIEARAISFTKGCYVGQEVIIRVLHRGHGRVARKLVGLKAAGEYVPAAGAAVAVDGCDIGRVTSGAWSPALNAGIALGYVHRDYIEPGTQVTIAGHPATVSALPFLPPRSASE